MATSPLITFKAGRCTFEGRKVVPSPTPGYIYLFSEDDLLHFCWRPRSAPATAPDLDLIMFPQDGSFVPLYKEEPSSKTSGVLFPLLDDGKKGETGNLHSPTNGRIFVLRFGSSSQKHFFWMQSHVQHTDRESNLSWWSQRDQNIGRIVDGLLQGDDVNVESEIDKMQRREWGQDDDDGDAMDVDRAGATGGDVRQEGSGSREGGADGGRA